MYRLNWLSLITFTVLLVATVVLAPMAQARNIHLPDLRNDVTIYWDQYHIPHIYAENDHDLFMAQGYVHASKRFFEMDFIRRFAGGRLAELIGGNVFGSNIVDQDREAREQGFLMVAEANYNALDPARQAELQAYADGVNAWIEYIQTVEPGSMPSEYFLLAVTPAELAPWEPTDTLLLLCIQAVGHTLDMGDDFSLARRIPAWLATFNQDPSDPRADVFDYLYNPIPVEPIASASKWPDLNASVAPDLMAPDFGRMPIFNEIYEKLGDDYWRRLEERYANRKPGPFDPRFKNNSNSWAVKGSMTTTGHPMFAADPHQDLQNPPIFFQNHLNSADANGTMNFAGVSIPGMPGIAIGFSERMAWGLTNGQIDVTDTYIEKVKKDVNGEPEAVWFNNAWVDIDYIHQKIRVKNGPGNYYDVNYTLMKVPHHGLVIPSSWDPDMNVLITYKNLGYEPTYEYRAFSKLARGRGVDDFYDAMEDVTNGQAFVVADINNNLLFFSRYKMPMRDPAGLTPDNPPWLPYDGQGGFEWYGAYPKERNIWEFNPDQNFIATSNQDPVGATFDGNPLPTSPEELYIGDLFDFGLRQKRITEMIMNTKNDRPAGSKIDLDFMKKMQGDHTSTLGSRMTDRIIQAIDGGSSLDQRVLDARALLVEWRDTHQYWAASGMDANATVAEIRASAATSIFNLWLTRFMPSAVEDEYRATGHGLFSANGSTYGQRGLLRMWEDFPNDHPIWDDLNTGAVETRDELIIQAMVAAIDWLENKFSSMNPEDWRWGDLHRVTLESPFGINSFNIPPFGQPGFPRPGDGNGVDACGDWVRGERFTYSGGPSYRLVVSLEPGNVVAYGALPGGQDGSQASPYYDNEMREYWVKNKYHPLYIYKNDVLANTVSTDVMSPIFVATPTPSPSPSPTSTPIMTLPVVALGGYLSTDLKAGQDGLITMMAFSSDMPDSVMLAYEGTPTTLALTGDGTGVYTWNLPVSGLPEAMLTLELVPMIGSTEGLYWPYLDVR